MTECIAPEHVCQFVSWISEFWIGSIRTLEEIRRHFITLHDAYPQLFSPQTLFGIITTSLAIWKWLQAREDRLFRKFEEMITREEGRLAGARANVLDLILRPGPGRAAQLPAFAVGPLIKVLKQRNWLPILRLTRVPKRTEKNIDGAINRLDLQITAAERQLSYFREQKAAARLIKAAVVSVRAQQAATSNAAEHLHHTALGHIHDALAVHGREDDIAAVELQGLQQQKLRGFEAAAIATFERMGRLATALPPTSLERPMTIARANRHEAELRYPINPGIAQGLLAAAIDKIQDHPGIRNHALLELAQTLHLDGIACLRLGQVVQGPLSLDTAKTNYERLLKTTRPGPWTWLRRLWPNQRRDPGRTAELRKRATVGLADVEHLITIAERHPRLLYVSLQRGNGERRRNRKP